MLCSKGTLLQTSAMVSPVSSSKRRVLTALIIQAGVKDVITLFHAPKNPVSTRVHTLLKQLNATAVAHATEDQASDHSKQSKLERTEFELGM